MSKNSLFFLFLIFSQIVVGQISKHKENNKKSSLYNRISHKKKIKKSRDTVYVYEEVIVHDTVYVDKKLRIDSVSVVCDLKSVSNKFNFWSNGKIIIIPQAKINLKKINDWKLSSKFFFEQKINSFNKKFQSGNAYNIGLGLDIEKMLFRSRIYFGLGFDFIYDCNPLKVDVADNTYFNGYYIDNIGNPKLFNSFYSSKFQYQPRAFFDLILTKSMSVNFGGLISFQKYQMDFESFSNSSPPKIESFNVNIRNLAYFFELKYHFKNKYSLGIFSSFGNSTKFTATNPNNSLEYFDFNKDITETKIGVNMSYRFL